MVQTYPVTEFIQTLAEAEARFELTVATDPNFLSELTRNLPNLEESDLQRLDLIRQRFQYHRKYGQLAESTVNAIVVSPLLEMAGFYDPPFRLQSEVSVSFEIEDVQAVLRGRIDSLVLLDQIWVLLVESKQTSFSK